MAWEGFVYGRLPWARQRSRCWPAARRSPPAGRRPGRRVREAARPGAHLQPAQRPAPGVRARARAVAPVRAGCASPGALRRAGGGRQPTASPSCVRCGSGAPARKTVRLKLTRSGRRILGSCRALVIDAKGRRGGTRFAAGTRAVRRDPRRCSAAAEPAGRRGRRPATRQRTSRRRPANPKPLGALDTANADRCDFLDPSLCLYPLPNDHFTVADTSKATGRRLNTQRASTPKQHARASCHRPADQNRADGFSPGNMIVTRVPGLDSQEAFDQTGAVPITDMERSFDPDQPVVVINARTSQRQLIWAEIDSNPRAIRKPEDVTLIIRPGKNFEEGERYIVALRAAAQRRDGTLLEPREEFRAYRDGISDRPTRTSRRGARTSRGSSRRSATRGSPARTSTWPGTSPWRASESLSGPRAGDARRRLRAARRPDLADLDVRATADVPAERRRPGRRRRRARRRGHRRSRTRSTSARSTATRFPPCSAGDDLSSRTGRATRTARRVDRPARGALLPQPAGLPAGRRLPLNGEPCADRRQHHASPT